LNGEPKQYLKAIGAVRSDWTQGWILAYAERTAKGIRIGGFASVSDGMAIVSEAEKLAQVRLNDEQCPVMIAVAADTAQVGFYPFSVPLVEGSKLEALIAAQAEAVVPMPLTQAAFSWRIVQKDSTMQHGFLLAVRRGYFQELAGLVSKRVGSILPDATGLVRAWSVMFESTSQRCLLIQIRRHHCILALCERGKLIRAAAVDWDGPAAVGTLVCELLNLLETLDVASSAPFYIIGPDSQAQLLCNELMAAGRSASLWELSPDKLRSVGLAEVGPEVLHCPQAAGLALAALEEEPAEFDLIRRPSTRSSAQVVLDKQLLVRGLAWAAVVLMLLLAVSYWTARKEIGAIRQALAAAHQDTTGEKILARQQMRERIAKARPDMPELLAMLNTCAPDVLVDSFNFKKGQSVRITAKTGSFERVYEFQKKLQTQTGISDVKLISPTRDEKKKQVQFTLTFAYRNFSR